MFLYDLTIDFVTRDVGEHDNKFQDYCEHFLRQLFLMVVMTSVQRNVLLQNCDALKSTVFESYKKITVKMRWCEKRR